MTSRLVLMFVPQKYFPDHPYCKDVRKTSPKPIFSARLLFLGLHVAHASLHFYTNLVPCSNVDMQKYQADRVDLPIYAHGNRLGPHLCATENFSARRTGSCKYGWGTVGYCAGTVGYWWYCTGYCTHALVLCGYCRP